MSRLDFLKSKLNTKFNPVIDDAYKLHGKDVIDDLLLKCQSSRLISKAQDLTAQNMVMMLEQIAETPRDNLVYTKKGASLNG